VAAVGGTVGGSAAAYRGCLLPLRKGMGERLREPLQTVLGYAERIPPSTPPLGSACAE
jgi:hypothetical protein